MQFFDVLNVVFALSLFFDTTSALVARAAVRAPTFTVSTYAGEATGFPYVGRDGGGGGTLNGKNVIIYSDTTTTNAAGAFVNFSSNSYAFVPDPKDPLKLQDFGSSQKPEVPTEIVPWYGTETCQKNFIWPNNPLVTQYNDPNAKQAYAVYAVGSRTSDGFGSYLYSTLVSIQASDSGLTMTRAVPQLYPIDGVRYDFATASHSDSNLYLFGSDGKGGLKLARVPWNSASQTSQYTYWSNSGWVSDSKSAITVATTIGGAQFSSGDAFWSDYYGTWIIISLTTYMTQIYIQHSQGGHIVGPYSAPVLLLNTAQACCNKDGGSIGNYAGHAYPQWLGTKSNELILSWTYDNSKTHMALVTFS